MSLESWHIDIQARAREVLIAAIAASPDVPRPDVAWEAKRYEPGQGPYIAETFRPDTQRVASISGGPHGTIEHRATVALTLFYPPGDGVYTARRMVGRLMAAFAPGFRLERNDSSARVSNVDPRPGYQDADRYVLPVNIALVGHSTT